MCADIQYLFLDIGSGRFPDLEEIVAQSNSKLRRLRTTLIAANTSASDEAAFANLEKKASR